MNKNENMHFSDFSDDVTSIGKDTNKTATH